LLFVKLSRCKLAHKPLIYNNLQEASKLHRIKPEKRIINPRNISRDCSPHDRRICERYSKRKRTQGMARKAISCTRFSWLLSRPQFKGMREKRRKIGTNGRQETHFTPEIRSVTPVISPTYEPEKTKKHPTPWGQTANPGRNCSVLLNPPCLRAICRLCKPRATRSASRRR
jgi:hypothetical protein